MRGLGAWSIARGLGRGAIARPTAIIPGAERFEITVERLAYLFSKRQERGQ